MKTAKEIRSEIAKKHGYNDWYDAQEANGETFLDEISDEAMEEYASQFRSKEPVVSVGLPSDVEIGNLIIAKLAHDDYWAKPRNYKTRLVVEDLMRQMYLTGFNNCIELSQLPAQTKERNQIYELKAEISALQEMNNGYAEELKKFNYNGEKLYKEEVNDVIEEMAYDYIINTGKVPKDQKEFVAALQTFYKHLPERLKEQICALSISPKEQQNDTVEFAEWCFVNWWNYNSMKPIWYNSGKFGSTLGGKTSQELYELFLKSK